ncbi:mycofactocin-coupled SDR family oxidoreductase [Pseudonocardia oroxyli]|uniref:(+)-trans-carveol dehydrogenase n=1 Tax=Pseudonocardia oroxyli TaxID=366584 RepID=A0A1G7TRU6_PSEOR|nr:mycofactocin-coupled SDR family oxidoreductase [Pseudonocardia oroxyli]SDG37694.1 (+)-trans-carveol dehydrogenase [Pseudonocardia oroxyli]
MTAPAGKLAGKVALITGAARGQGRNHAVRLAAEGADIIAVDLCEQIDEVRYPMSTEEDLAETVSAVEALDRRIVARKADVREAEALASVVEEGVAELGRLDVVCANAGIITPHGGADRPTALAAKVAAFRLMVDVNLTGVFATIEAARPALTASGGGSIVITSSLAGLRALGVMGGYTESKHGLVGLMRAAAIELAPARIRVNSVHPTSVRTPMIMNDQSYRSFRPDLDHPTAEDVAPTLAAMHLLDVPYVEPDDISAAVLWLASDEARYVTGVALPVDAGGVIR